MTNTEKIARALEGIRGDRGGRSDSEGSSHQMHSQRETRQQADKEKAPDWYQRTQSATTDRGDWSGGSMGGRGWSGGRER